jgi:ABC-type antimicrobial peptide transport system permease subunit
VGTLDVTHAFGKTIGWEIIAGRDFDESIVSDSSAFVINETAARMMGFTDPIGEVVYWKSKWHQVDKDFRIIGVIRDMVMKSPYDKTMPQVYYLRNFVSTIHVRLSENVIASEAVKKIGQVCKSIAPEAPFDFNFADADYDRKFAYEERVAKLATVFAVLAIIISCLGLFGMALFMTERRTKEIGIRKVVGASVAGLWKLMSTEFVVLVGLSFVIAVPIAWYGLATWMENFIYRTDISWQVFAAAGLGSVSVTLLTVSFQLLKAANRSPVESLKTE